ncbi:MAG: hypothetical protein H6765_04780 [Candidatus Peribacteria bacterium]|nr:MAG: hypothetical protein H6765_04780 [Candidatus Peribacteria bacterium]
MVTLSTHNSVRRAIHRNYLSQQRELQVEAQITIKMNTNKFINIATIFTTSIVVVIFAITFDYRVPTLGLVAIAFLATMASKYHNPLNDTATKSEMYLVMSVISHLLALLMAAANDTWGIFGQHSWNGFWAEVIAYKFPIMGGICTLLILAYFWDWMVMVITRNTEAAHRCIEQQRFTRRSIKTLKKYGTIQELGRHIREYRQIFPIWFSRVMMLQPLERNTQGIELLEVIMKVRGLFSDPYWFKVVNVYMEKWQETGDPIGQLFNKFKKGYHSDQVNVGHIHLLLSSPLDIPAEYTGLLQVAQSYHEAASKWLRELFAQESQQAIQKLDLGWYLSNRYRLNKKDFLTSMSRRQHPNKAFGGNAVSNLEKFTFDQELVGRFFQQLKLAFDHARNDEEASLLATIAYEVVKEGASSPSWTGCVSYVGCINTGIEKLEVIQQKFLYETILHLEGKQVLPTDHLWTRLVVFNQFRSN